MSRTACYDYFPDSHRREYVRLAEEAKKIYGTRSRPKPPSLPGPLLPQTTRQSVAPESAECPRLSASRRFLTRRLRLKSTPIQPVSSISREKNPVHYAT